MVKYKLEDGSIIDVTDYSQDEIDFLLMQNPEAELIEEEKEKWERQAVLRQRMQL